MLQAQRVGSPLQSLIGHLDCFSCILVARLVLRLIFFFQHDLWCQVWQQAALLQPVSHILQHQADIDARVAAFHLGTALAVGLGGFEVDDEAQPLAEGGKLALLISCVKKDGVRQQPHVLQRFKEGCELCRWAAENPVRVVVHTKPTETRDDDGGAVECWDEVFVYECLQCRERGCDGIVPALVALFRQLVDKRFAE